MWRWSLHKYHKPKTWVVFSTYVEMILSKLTTQAHGKSILHVCGDDPCIDVMPSDFKVYSPRMWRWSLSRICKSWCPLVFSTYVEMILFSGSFNSGLSSILHVCGDDPNAFYHSQAWRKYSPRMWRWSSVIYYVCVYPYSILHVSGGDPIPLTWLMK